MNSPLVGDFKHGYDSVNCSKDLLRRSFKYTKLQERKMFKDSILLHSEKLEIPVDLAGKKRKCFKSDLIEGGERASAKTFVKVLE